MRDHPRVCGEHLGCLRILVPTQGSSPRMRGTPTIRPVECPRRRIIPAYAGNTRRRLCWFLSPRDHPRVCGEHSLYYWAVFIKLGSSPRMRGTHKCLPIPLDYHGIIPAYAGNTGCPIALARKRWDHPRVCGEHISAFQSLSITMGSSPRMRGTLGAQLRLRVSVGIIPAYAGNTRPCCSRPTRNRDHPRVCGEHYRRYVRCSWW